MALPVLPQPPRSRIPMAALICVLIGPFPLALPKTLPLNPSPSFNRMDPSWLMLQKSFPKIPKTRGRGRPIQSTLQPPQEVFSICGKRDAPASIVLHPSMASTSPWRGWGTSLSWWANFAGGMWPAPLKVTLDLLFGPKGLNLNIVRYNIGGGASRKTLARFLQAGAWRYRAMPGFKMGPRSPYNWDADWRQRRVLFGAKGRGADTFIAYSNSAPWWMTVTGDIAGNGPNTTNLNPQYYSEFAEYLTEVVKQYYVRFNIRFDHLAPMNEPLERWWIKGGMQEGCYYSPSQIAQILPAVARSLKRKGLSTTVAGVDSWPESTGAAFTRARQQESAAIVSSIHVHGYLQPDPEDPVGLVVSQFTAIRDLAYKHRKEVWMSEWGPMYWGGRDLDIALVMARCIIQAVNIMQISAWVYWQAVDSGDGWSLLQLRWNQDRPFPFQFSKKYFVLKQFTTYAKRGSIPLRLGAGTSCRHCVASFYNRREHSLSVFVVNQEARRRHLRISLKSFRRWDWRQNCSIGMVWMSWNVNSRSQSLGLLSSLGTVDLSVQGLTMSTVQISNLSL